LAAFPFSTALAAQFEGVPREKHPWAQFKIGSWKRVRTVTEDLDAKGAVASKSMTETTTKLVDVHGDYYTLRVDVVVEVAGKRFSSNPQFIRRGFNGETDDRPATVKRLGAGRFQLGRDRIECEVQQITVDAGDSRRITTVHLSPRLAPFVLKRETSSVDAAGKPADFHSEVEVLAVDMPAQVLNQTKPTSHVRILNQQGKTSSITLEVHSVDVPGGVVSHSSKEKDETGRVTRRSTLELVDYALGTGEDPDAQYVRRVFHRRAQRKAMR
jgi:hypothetical protein